MKSPLDSKTIIALIVWVVSLLFRWGGMETPQDLEEFLTQAWPLVQLIIESVMAIIALWGRTVADQPISWTARPKWLGG